MSVNNKLMAPGTFNVFLNLESTPNSVVNSIVPWGNIVLTPTRVNASEFSDSQLRDMSKYVGIVQAQTISEEGIEISGKGILSYLGDTDSRGLVLARNAGVGAVRAYSTDTLSHVIDRSDATPYGLLRDESAAQRAVRKGTVTEISFDDTVLLLNFNGSDEATTITDSSEYTSNQTITVAGDAKLDTAIKKYGTASLQLTSGNSYVNVADRPELDLAYHDFTIEWWEYRVSGGTNPTVAGRDRTTTYAPWVVGKEESGTAKLYISGNGTSWDVANGVSMGTVNLNQWNHFAVTRKGKTFRTFKNGTQVSTFDDAEAFIRVNSNSMSIGSAQGGNYFRGYIDDFRITRGTSLYNANFTAPTAELVKTTANKTYTGNHYMESAYKSLKTVCTALGAEFKMKNDGTLDVGPKGNLFNGHGTSTPTGMIVRRLSGPDPTITGYSGVDLSTEFNAEDYVSRVELIASNYGHEINLGQADAKSVPYKDLFGNELERIQILSENDIPDSMRDIRAEAYLNEYNEITKTLSVGLEDYDISGDIEVGDIIYVYDPDVGFEDTSTDAALENRDKYEITYQGQILNPIKIRVMGLSFPIAEGMGVYYRDKDGSYTDITDYIVFESGITQIEVGSSTPQLNQDLRASGSVIAIGGTNEFTVPDAPTGLAAASGTYQDGTGRPYSFAKLTWNEPTNTDGSRITDGNMYRVRWRMVQDRDGNNLIDSNDNQITQYQYGTVEFGTREYIVLDLNVGNVYEFGVACIDNSGFSGGFASLASVQMPRDTVAPPQPVAPTGSYGSVASNNARVQISHKLGAAKDEDGNAIGSPSNFSLPRDIDHLNVYRGTSSGFTPSASNFIGQIDANTAHIDLQITAVNEFPISTAGTAYYKVKAVDVAGNESAASTAASVTETLIETAYISDANITTAKIGDAQVTDAKIDTLSVGKLTAGTISGKTITIDTNSSGGSPVLGVIKSSNYSSGSAGWIIKSDGTFEGNSGNFRGDITGASGTFSGALSGATGTFTGSLSAGVVITTPAISGGSISGSSISIGSSNDIFRVDTDGDMWIGHATQGSAPFQVTKGGAITASSGSIGGISINSGDIQSSNYSANSAGFKLDGTNGIGYFHDIDLRLAAASSDTPSSGDTTLDIGGSQIYDYGGDIYLNAASSGDVVIASDDRLVLKTTANNPTLLFDATQSDFKFDVNNWVPWSTQTADRYYSNPSPFTWVNELVISNSTSDIMRFNGQNDEVYFYGDISVDTDARINIGNDDGSNGDVLTRTSTGMEWATASSGSHDHDSDYSATSHTHSYDNFDHIDINGLQMDSGFGLTIQAGTGISVSNSSSPHTITIANTATGLSSAVLSINGNTSGHHNFSTSGTGFFSNSDMDGSNSTHSFAFSSTMPSAASITTGHVLPNGTKNIGGFGTYWNYVYYNNLSGSSDERKKNSIEDIDVGLDFINTLKPRKFKWNVDENIECNTCGQTLETVGDDCTADNCEGEAFDSNLDRADDLQYGFIAQETIPLMPDSEQDYGLVNYKDDVDEYVMSYTSMVAPLVKALQELSDKNDALESRIEALEG